MAWLLIIRNITALYVQAGDYCFRLKQFNKALDYYQHALTKVIATKEEEASVRKKNYKIAIQNCAYDSRIGW